MAKKPAVSADEARRIAQETVGKYPPSKPPRAVLKRGGTGLSESEKKEVQKKRLIKKSQTTPQTKEQIEKKIAAERNARLSKVLRKVTARGTGTSVAGPKKGSTITVIKKASSPKQQAVIDRAKMVNPPDRKLDTSRKAAIKTAEEARSQKTPAQREQEQRSETQVKRPVRRSDKPVDPQQREADRRVAEGLKEIKAREATAAKAKAAQAKAKLKVRTPRLIKVRGGSGVRGTMGSIGSGGGMNWETK